MSREILSDLRNLRKFKWLFLEVQILMTKLHKKIAEVLYIQIVMSRGSNFVFLKYLMKIRWLARFVADFVILSVNFLFFVRGFLSVESKGGRLLMRNAG